MLWTAKVYYNEMNKCSYVADYETNYQRSTK